MIPWTVNEAADIERVIGWGVDGLITDYPDRAKSILDAKGIAVR
ncbi:MAG: glycerophosphodiester phosphodiesterase family protein [Tagaea sp.]